MPRKKQARPDARSSYRERDLSIHDARMDDAPNEKHDAPSEKRKERVEVRLDPVLQARLLEQMREEQAALIRTRELRNWVLLPTALFCLALGIGLSFSDNLMVAFLANTVATGVAIVLWRVNRDWIRDRIGF